MADEICHKIVFHFDAVISTAGHETALNNALEGGATGVATSYKATNLDPGDTLDIEHQLVRLPSVDVGTRTGFEWYPKITVTFSGTRRESMIRGRSDTAGNADKADLTARLRQVLDNQPRIVGITQVK